MSRSLFQKGASDGALKYPMTEASLPQTSDGLVDPRTGENPYNLPSPIYPHTSGFADQIEMFHLAREGVCKGIWPSAYFEALNMPASTVPAPLLMNGPNGKPHVDITMPVTAATLVHMDKPEDLGSIMFDWLWMEIDGKNLFDGHDMYLPVRTQFIQLLGHVLMDAYEAFMSAKWYFGLIRPEEYFRLDGSVITEYPEGCPKHQAYPAGHATFASATAWLLILFFKGLLTEHQISTLKLTARFFAHFRTFAGVHWPQDNEVGLVLGERVVAAQKDLEGFDD